MGFKRNAYTEGGMKGVLEFTGRLEEIEEEVEGNYGPQDAYHYYDVEITESEEEVDLDEGRFTSWTKHSSRKNSVAGKTAFAWMDFAEAHNLEPDADDDLTPVQQVASAFKDKHVRYRRVTHEFGEGMNPGSSFVPVELMEKAPAKPAGRGTKPAPAKPTPSKPAKKEPAPEIVEAIVAAVGEDGATRDIIRREVVKKAALRTALGASGGLDTVLAILVDLGTLTESEGYYAPVSAEDLP